MFKFQNKIPIFLLFFFLLFLFSLFLFTGNHQDGEDTYSVSDEGRVHFPLERGKIQFHEIVLDDNENYYLSKIIYDSGGADIFALLRIPKNRGNGLPAIVLLPGATVTKEAEQRVAQDLAEMGYVTLTLDERGQGGETVAGVPPLEYDYSSFLNNATPVQHLMVFDALRAVDFLKTRAEVDKNKIALIGESMGGRYAIIAAAIDPSIKGVVGISTSGYNISEGGNENATRFLRSIDPDNYIALISPRKLILIHSANDNIIPIQIAKNTFDKAKEPKRFIEVECPTHGYCDEMKPLLEQELEQFFE